MIKVYGKWNAEKIIKKLLEYEELTGADVTPFYF